MSSLIVRQVDESLKLKLRMRAAKNGRSMEEEVRYILRIALTEDSAKPNLFESIRRRFEPLGGVELELPERELARELPGLFE